MNFDYGKSFVNFDLKRKVEGKKGDEPKKGNEEVKTEEPQKPQLSEPKTEKITANANEVMANYAKGSILPTKDTENINPAKAGGVSSKVPINMEELISQWETNNETMTNEQKMELLTQIINAYGNDENGAAIWRVRRATVAYEISTQNYLQFLQSHPNGGYSIGDVPNQYVYDGFVEDSQAFNNLSNNYGNLNPEQKVAVREYGIKYCAMSVISDTIYSKAVNITNPEFYLSNIQRNAYHTFWGVNQVINDTGMQNEPWHDLYVNEYQPLFDKFRNNINEMSQENVLTIVNNLKELVGMLDEKGFPYCDELRISIQGYLIFAGYDKPDLLPYPSTNE